MKKILVPVDFSDHSAHALKIASDLARKNNLEIIVLHVIEIDEPLMGTDQYYVEDKKMVFFMKLAQQKFAEFLDKEYLKDLTIIDLMEAGSTTHGIAHTVEKYTIDFIVINFKSSRDPEGTLIGPTTEKLVRDSEIPVLVIKDETVKFQLRTIVFAVDFSLENLVPYQRVKRFARDFNAELTLMYINTPGEKFKSSREIDNKIREFFNTAETSYPHENTAVYNDYTVEKGVLNGAHAMGADLIAMPTHGRKGLAHFFSGSIAEDVAHHSHIPIITFKIDEQ